MTTQRPSWRVILSDKFALLSLAFLAVMTICAAGAGVADLYSLRPPGAMDERPVQKVEASKLVDALVATNVALRLDPGNPSYREDRARLDYWEAERSGGARKAELLEDALFQIRKAIRLRPVSPYGWSTLMQVKMSLGEIDPEFFDALDNASTLGPWEPEIQRAVADAGLNVWGMLTDTQKGKILDDFKRGMKRQSAEMMRIAMRNRIGCIIRSGKYACN